MTLSTRGLDVWHGSSLLVQGICLDVAAGSVTTLFGPSGAGKSTIAAALAGVERPGLRVDGVVERPHGVAPGHLPQHAADTLNPSRRVGTALSEFVSLHGTPPRGRRARRVWLHDELRSLLALAGFPADETHARLFLHRYPFEFSGGQRTRLALAQVLAARPEVLILDEPTNGLDDAGRDTLCGMLERIRDRGCAILLVTHDPVVARRLSDEIVFVDDGRVVPGELPATGPASALDRAGVGPGVPEPVLQVRDLGVRAEGTDLIRGIDLEVGAGETLGLVGRSGAGKTTVARAIAGLVPLHSGEVRVDGEPYPRLGKRDRAHKAACQLVWQEAAASFVPWTSVIDQVARTRMTLCGETRADAGRAARDTLADLGLAAEVVRRRPTDLSGGQLRRAAIARAVLAEPRVLVCDEVTTGLDRGLAREILDFLDEHQRRTGSAVVLISHDLETASSRFDRTVELRSGRIAEDRSAPEHV